MLTKIIAFTIQAYAYYKALTPPIPNSPTKKILSTEGIVGMLIAQFLPFTIMFNIVQSIIYVYIMYQQETGSVPIFPNENYRLSEWNKLDVFCFACIVGGSLLRLWCFEYLKDYFTFHVTIKKGHKLIKNGPYSLLAHPSYTGGILVLAYHLITYRLCHYIPVYFPSVSPNWNMISTFYFIVAVVDSILIYKRVIYEERALKKRFGKEWNVYFSQRKRFIPYIF